MLAASAEGAAVTTVEGLAKSKDDLHPMQVAFKENHGLQCGFCTPGMIMTATDMVARYQAEGKALTEENIRHELEGNICRCTGYHNIVKSIVDGASKMTSA
jgi:carbon-monoxide dehydrogenase small subunit